MSSDYAVVFSSTSILRIVVNFAEDLDSILTTYFCVML